MVAQGNNLQSYFHLKSKPSMPLIHIFHAVVYSEQLIQKNKETNCAATISPFSYSYMIFFFAQMDFLANETFCSLIYEAGPPTAIRMFI